MLECQREHRKARDRRRPSRLQDLERQARLTAKDAIEKGALEMGILEQAQRNAESGIRSLLETVGVKLAPPDRS